MISATITKINNRVLTITEEKAFPPDSVIIYDRGLGYVDIVVYDKSGTVTTYRTTDTAATILAASGGGEFVKIVAATEGRTVLSGSLTVYAAKEQVTITEAGYKSYASRVDFKPNTTHPTTYFYTNTNVEDVASSVKALLVSDLISEDLLFGAYDNQILEKGSDDKLLVQPVKAVTVADIKALEAAGTLKIGLAYKVTDKDGFIAIALAPNKLSSFVHFQGADSYGVASFDWANEVYLWRKDDKGNYVEGNTNIDNFDWDAASVSNVSVINGCTFTMDGSGSANISNCVFDGGTVDLSGVTSALSSIKTKNAVLDFTNTTNTYNGAYFEHCNVTDTGTNAVARTNVVIKGRTVELSDTDSEVNLYVDKFNSNKVITIDLGTDPLITVGGMATLDFAGADLLKELSYVGEIIVENAGAGDVKAMKTKDGLNGLGLSVGSNLRVTNNSTADLTIADSGLNESSEADLQEIRTWSGASLTLTAKSAIDDARSNVDFVVGVGSENGDTLLMQDSSLRTW